jgi:serine/threonine protein kinase
MTTASSPEIAPVAQGEILDGKYRVERVLGVGGMGVVVAATHVQLQTRVALKFLLPAALGNAQIIERFAREARAAVQIRSEHVARVTDVGTLPTGSPYMVMEYLEGSDLAQALEKDGPMPVIQAVGYLLEACEAIAEAHSLGIVHRDLKPANLFLARRPNRDSIVKVLDFGISKMNGAGSGLTQTSAMMGSPQYMAPEQMMSSKDVDARADIWGLGVILYELLTGAPPFTGETLAEIVFTVTQRDAAPLLSKRADLPPALAGVVACAMARERAQRFPNVAKLAAALAPFGPSRSDISIERISRMLGTTEPPPPPLSAAAPMPMHATAAAWTHSQAGLSARPKTRFFVAAAAVAVLVAGAVVWRVMRTGSEGPSTTSASAAPSPRATTAAPTADTSSAPQPPALPAVTALVPLPPPEAMASALGTTHPELGTAASARGHAPPGPKRSLVPTGAAASAPAPPAPASHGLNMGMKE